VIEYTVRHLLAQVDHIIIRDNISKDGTRQIIEGLKSDRITLQHDGVIAYIQSKKTTAMAKEAHEMGFTWVLPCDADEIWYAPEGRRIGDFLDGIAPDVRMASAQLFNHLPSAEDSDDPNPFKRIGWRQRQHAPLGKICARTGIDLVIHQGNHGAYVDGSGLTVGGLVVRHFSWRSEEQYLRKIRNGAAAYAATNMDETIGAHWRMFDGAEDEAIRAHFRQWFFSSSPRSDNTLIFDPTPITLTSVLD
jgi:glycosyltransferase involved in cell wall biosynthesis